MPSELPLPNTNAPQWVEQDPSSICTTGKPPQVVTGMLLWIMRRHFSEADYIVNEDLKDCIWDSDSTKSQITIEPITKWNGAPTQTLQQRPAIYIKRNAYTNSRIGIGDKYMIGTKGRVDNSASVGHTTVNGSTGYGTLLVGSYTLFCIGQTGAAAEAVGTEAYFELLEFAPLISRDFGFNKFQVMEMGGINKLEESMEHWVIPVTVGCVHAHDWELTVDLPYFKSVSLNT